ncbi:hypothetical protein WD019_17065 [Fictibacillus sp. Mic-4]|nr:hypothetical protein [Fictibacillus gelatini]
MKKQIKLMLSIFAVFAILGTTHYSQKSDQIAQANLKVSTLFVDDHGSGR